MSKKTPEEIAALKAKYGDKTAEKEAKRAAKKTQFGDKNYDQNMPTVEMRIPWESEGREIDLEKPPWVDYCDALEYQYRVSVFLATNGKWPEYPVKRKVIRT